MKRARPANVDEYIALYPHEVQERLVEIRATIRKAAPVAAVPRLGTATSNESEPRTTRPGYGNPI